MCNLVKITVGAVGAGLAPARDERATARIAPTNIAIYDLRGNIVGARHASPDIAANIKTGDAGVAPTNNEYIWTPDKSVPSGIYLVKATIPQGQTHRSAPTVCTKRIVYLK